MFWYEVKSVGGRTLITQAKDSQQAKRDACKHWGIKPSDYWSGLTSLKARRLTEDEIETKQLR